MGKTSTAHGSATEPMANNLVANKLERIKQTVNITVINTNTGVNLVFISCFFSVVFWNTRDS